MIYLNEVYQEAIVDVEVSFDLDVSEVLNLNKLKEEIFTLIMSKFPFNGNKYLITVFNDLSKEFIAKYDSYLTKDSVKLMNFNLSTKFIERVLVRYSANIEVLNDNIIRFKLIDVSNLGNDYLYNKSTFHSDVLEVLRSVFNEVSSNNGVNINNSISIINTSSKFEDVKSIESRVIDDIAKNRKMMI